jgi:hypothetical protein
MREYDFNSSSHFFEDIFTFSLPRLGCIALARFPELKSQVRQLVTRCNVSGRGFRLPSRSIPNIVIPDKNVVPGKVVSSTLLNQQGSPIPTISYADGDLVSSLPGGRVTKPFPSAVLPPIAQVTIGSAYERVKDRIKNEWRADPHLWPPILQYFHHCRNAAFHGNHFDVRRYQRRPGIDSSAPPSWRSSVMLDDDSMNTRQLMGDWLDIGDVPILLGDVSDVLKASGISP